MTRNGTPNAFVIWLGGWLSMAWRMNASEDRLAELESACRILAVQVDLLARKGAAAMDKDVADSILEEFRPKVPRTLETCQALVLAGYVPYARKMVNGREKELISMPFPQDGIAIRGGGCGIGVMVREPDDPTTLEEWSIPVAEVRRAIAQRARKEQG